MAGVVGTSETSIWEQDGQYLAMLAGEAITLGKVVKIGSADSTVVTGTTGAAGVVGVAVAGYRTSRIATDNVVASGNMVTVATRGVVLVTAATAVTRGDLVGAGDAGFVGAGATTVATVLGMALDSAASGATVRIKLFRG